MNFTKNQLAFIIDAINMFEDSDDYVSEDGKYKLTESEIENLRLNLNLNLMWLEKNSIEPLMKEAQERPQDAPDAL